jgi:hypothetical protein
VPLSELRGSARVVIVAGTAPQVASALEEAEPLRAELIRRGVFVVPLPIYDASGQLSTSGGGADAAEPPGKDDLRWRAAPARPADWAAWFGEQLSLSAKATSERGLYVGLRIDGRVRASGQGAPPWGRFAAELAPLEGMWSGFADGFDGRV